MARIRSIKPEFWADEDLAIQLTRDERMLYLGLWNLADEHARLRGDPRYVKGQLFAYDDDLTAADVDKMLARLADIGKVVRYKSGTARYLYLPNLARHQRLDAAKVPSRLPSPSECDPDGEGSANQWPKTWPESDPDKSGRSPDESAPGADESVSEPDESVLLYGAGSREHVAGDREHVAGVAPGRAEIEPVPNPGARKTKDVVPAKPPRDDATRLCEHLASRIEANGSKRPTVTAKWLDAARLMLDADGRTEEQVHTAIDWCQDDEFWRANILSMPKLREKYDQLRMQAMRESSLRVSRKQQETDDMFDRAMERARQREAREAAGNDSH